ncbi:centlein, partial [Tachysurus ichikawai]
LQLNDVDEDRVSSTPLPAVHRIHSSIRKIEVLERKMVYLERETLKLREDKQTLQDTSDLLRSELEEARVREEVTQAQVSAERDRLLGEAQALQAQLEKSRRAQTASQAALMRVRQEVGVLRAERDFYRNKTRRGRRCGTHTITHSTVSLQPRRRSPVKDEWEDMSLDSDSEDVSDSRRDAHPLQSK